MRLVGPAGEQIGIVAINDALRLAQDGDLDLVEVAPNARPPVAKLMDYGKFKYESALKARESRKNQAQTVIKEIKLRPKIDPHDYGTKKGHVERFLKAGDKVKVTIMFRGREQSRPELGFKLLQRLAGDVEELGFVESQPKQDGRNMIMVIGPHKRKADARPEAKPEHPAREERAERVAARAATIAASAPPVSAPPEPEPEPETEAAAASAPAGARDRGSRRGRAAPGLLAGRPAPGVGPPGLVASVDFAAPGQRRAAPGHFGRIPARVDPAAEHAPALGARRRAPARTAAARAPAGCPRWPGQRFAGPGGLWQPDPEAERPADRQPAAERAAAECAPPRCAPAQRAATAAGEPGARAAGRQRRRSGQADRPGGLGLAAGTRRALARMCLPQRARVPE